MKKLFPLLICLLLGISAFAQDFTYGNVTGEELDMKKYDKDTSAHAVVLNEYGTTHIAFNADYRVQLTFTRHIKIKFFDNNEFESQGTFEIPVYAGNQQTYEEVQNVKATTWNKDENGY